MTNFDKEILVSHLFNDGDEKIYSLLATIGVDNGKSILLELLKLLTLTKNKKIKHQIAMILHDVGDERALPVLIEEIKADKNKGYAGPLIFACEVFDCSMYLDVFINILVTDTGEAAMTASLVIQNMKGPFNQVQLKNNIMILEKQSKLVGTPKNEFIKESLEYLKIF